MLLAIIAAIVVLGLVGWALLLIARRLRWTLRQCLVGAIVGLQAGLVGALLVDDASRGTRAAAVVLIGLGLALGTISLAAAATRPSISATESREP